MNQQTTLFEHPEITYKRLFRYTGSKWHASKHLAKLVPTSVRSVVSPFFGSGAFETYLTGRNIKVNGSDLFEPIVNLWNYLLVDGKTISKMSRDILTENDSESLTKFRDEAYFSVKDKQEQAAHFYNYCLLTWNGMPFLSPIRDYEMVDGYPAVCGRSEDITYYYKRIERFYNPWLKVNELDYRTQLKRFPNMFAYLDPPYPNVGNLYGTGSEFHEDFDHEELRDVLLKRESLWILSYSNDPLVFDLYSNDKFVIKKQWWWQPANNNKRGREVVITPRKHESYLKEQICR